jgi:hypothetical protein
MKTNLKKMEWRLLPLQSNEHDEYGTTTQYGEHALEPL